MSKPSGAHCEIVIAATVGEAISEWFDGFTVTQEGASSRLVGTIIDQTALHGVLGRLRDLGLPILDVHIAPGSAAPDLFADAEIHPRVHDAATTEPYGSGAYVKEEANDPARIRN